MRVALLTNRTTQLSLPILESLAKNAKLDLQHIYFYDTLAEVRRSPLKLLANLGVRQSCSKLRGLLTSRIRRFAAELQAAADVPPRTAFEFAKLHRLQYSLITNINDPLVISPLTGLRVDALIVCACKNILRRSVLAIPGTLCVNIHPSMLPKYRGPTPTFWALYHDESETGVTIHGMTADIDHGPILAQIRRPLDPQKSEMETEIELLREAADLLRPQLFRLLTENPRELVYPDRESGSYFGYPTPAHRRELSRRLSRNSTQHP